jgi:hypothetical protein
VPASTTGQATRPALPRLLERLAQVGRSARTRRVGSVARPGYLLIAAEVLLIFFWSIVVTRPLLNLDSTVVPHGREYLSAIQSHHLWSQMQTCGACAFWNGSLRGGTPAFVDPYGSMLHPLVMLTTLGWGVINGSKLALVGAFFSAGLAQLWLGYVLGVGRVARLWSACMAVAAGHLAGRLDIGTFGLVISTVACTLVLPPLIALIQNGNRRMAVLLGVMLGLALLAGQGYMQIALLFTLPAVLLILPWERDRLLPLLRNLALAGGIACLLAAPFLVPLLHFLPEFGKETDLTFRGGQPFAYVPLNLVISDADFFRSEALQMLPYPYLYVNYVGWIAILLAVWGLLGSRGGAAWRMALCLGGMALLALWAASGQPFALVVALSPERLAWQVASIRFHSVMASLAVPPILALAALGLDRLLRRPWPQVQFGLAGGEAPRMLRVSLRWVMLVPLLLALFSAWSFGRNWIKTSSIEPKVAQVLDSLETPGLQWVNPPFGEHAFVTPGVERGLKLGNGVRPWHWKNRSLPAPLLEADTQGQPPGMEQQSVVAGVPIYAGPAEREYAQVQHADAMTVCTAQGQGGNIDVQCDLSQPGMLTVRENNWSGWRATVDGEATALQPGPWLAVELPAGEHNVQLRYRPWDVPLGLLLGLVGVALAGYSWWRG